MRAKLRDILPLITHDNYRVYVQSNISAFTNNPLELTDNEDIKNHLDYPVLAINEDWSIILHNNIS